MSGIRQPVVAGRFYPAGEAECLRMLEEMRRRVDVEGRAVGAIVPHAGWVYSGRTAALGVSAVAAAEPETVVVFGAVHTMDLNYASAFTTGAWATPCAPRTAVW